MKNFVPICFYPTKKIILDDDSIFSDAIVFQMKDKLFSAYTSPKKLLNYLLQEYSPTLDQNDFFEKSEIDAEISPCINFSIPIKKLKSLISTTPSDDISILLIDYHMKDMTGIDFLNKIKNYPFKKILITGEQDYAVGVDALNDGLIDAYIRKDDPNLLDKLQKLVSILEWKYFTDLSSAAYFLPELSYLTNNLLIETFEKFIAENKISTFILENKEGDFSVHNSTTANSNKTDFIIIRTKNQLQNLSLLAKEDGAREDVINYLERAEMIPFFGNKKFWEVPAAEWKDFLYPVNLLTSNSTLVGAFIPDYSKK